MKIFDMAIYVLENTSDGDKLSPNQLKITEMAVNGELNDLGKKEFEKLYNKVKDGNYVEWLHNVEHMTIDLEGHVKYKNNRVEHFSPCYIYSEEAKIYTIKIAKACKILEDRNEKINFNNMSKLT